MKPDALKKNEQIEQELKNIIIELKKDLIK